MSNYKVDIWASFIISHKQTPDYAREAVIKMIKGSGFDEKNFTIEINKIGEINLVVEPKKEEIKPIKAFRKTRVPRKKEKVKKVTKRKVK